MLRVIINPPRPEKNLQVSQQVSNDEQHQNHPCKGDDHFLTDGGAIKRREGGHESNTVVLFNLAFNHDRAVTHKLAAYVPLPASQLVS